MQIRSWSRSFLFSISGCLSAAWMINACGTSPGDSSNGSSSDSSETSSIEDESEGDDSTGVSSDPSDPSEGDASESSDDDDDDSTSDDDDDESSSDDDDDESSGDDDDDDDDSTSDDDDDDDSTSDDDDDDSTSDDDDDESSGDDDDDDDESDTGTDPKWLARNIELSLVEVTQGVQVVLSKDGSEVAVDDRNSDIIEQRGMLVRAHWTLGSGWKDREIEAVLTLKDSDGKTESFPLRKMIEEDSDANRLDGTFNWKVDADKVLEDLALSVELREVDESQVDEPEPDPAPRYPEKDQADLNVVKGPMELRVKVILGDTESGALEANADHQETLVNRLLDANPAQRVILEVSDPIKHDNFENANEMFTFLRDLREEEDADPNVYYHLMLLREDHDGLGWSGIANLPGDSKQAASRRVSITLTRDNIGRGAGVVLHELGHNQGRRHAPCGGAGGPDPDYPYDEAAIGVQGYSLQRERLYDPIEIKDYMSYCFPGWVSDYYWRLYIERIRTLSSWNYGEGQSALKGRTLIGWLDADGSAKWQIVRGAIGEGQLNRSDSFRARFWNEGVVSRELPMAIEKIEHTDAYEVYIPFGDQLNAESIEVDVLNKRFRVDLANIQVIAEP